MKWNKYKLKINEDAEEFVVSALADAGIQGVEIEDKIPLSESDLQQMFVDIPPESGEDDGIAYLSFYLDPIAEDVPAVLARVREELDALRVFCDIGEGSIEATETEDKDWENEWKKFFKPFWIDDIYVVPSWIITGDGSFDRFFETATKDADFIKTYQKNRPQLLLRIDPGTAFGTGMHETTQLCIRQMRKYLPEDARVLDIGTGSGILGILALKFGAAAVLGTDLDPNAEPAVEENCRNNGIEYLGRIDDPAAPAGSVPAGTKRGFSLLFGNLADDADVQRAVGRAGYDLVLTNILADVLVALAPAVADALAPGGQWITSGILEGKENDVIAAAEAAGLVLEEVVQQGEWMSVTAKKTI